MGGFGSGRRAWGAKRWTVEEALALDVRRLTRAGGLAPAGTSTAGPRCCSRAR